MFRSNETVCRYVYLNTSQSFDFNQSLSIVFVVKAGLELRVCADCKFRVWVQFV